MHHKFRTEQSRQTSSWKHFGSSGHFGASFSESLGYDAAPLPPAPQGGARRQRYSPPQATQ
eukprot:3307386-Amphidinium_carterae.1